MDQYPSYNLRYLAIALGADVHQGAFKLGDRLIKPSMNRIEWNGSQTHLEPKIMQVLVCLAEHSGEVVGKDDLMRTVWADTFVTDDVLKRCVSELRKALGDDAREPHFIETIPKGGYRLVAPLRYLPSESASEIAVPRRARSRLLLHIAIAAAVLLAVVGALLRLHSPVEREPRIFPLTTLPGAEAMTSFSPDGSQIVFSWTGDHPSRQESALYIKVIGAERQRRLTEFGAFPAWSPDGRQIAFHRAWGDAEHGIFSISPLGGPERKLTNTSLHPDDVLASQISWSRDGRFLAFSDWRQGSYLHDLYLLDMQTLERTKIDIPPDCDGMQPAYSPAGNEMAFVCQGQRVFVRQGVNGKIRAMEFPPGLFMGLTWSADGNKVIVSRLDGFTPELWQAPAAGGRAARLIYGRGAWWPVAAPQDNRLAFTQWVWNVNIWRLELHTATSTSGSPSKHIVSSTAQAQPQYSPDGKRIVFTSLRSGSPEIWVCDSDGSNPVQLTFDTKSKGTPRWSPDGTTISFDAESETGWDIYLVHPDDAAPHKLQLNTNDNHTPSWSHDAHWIYYSVGSGKKGKPQIFKAPAAGGQAIQITRGGGDLPVEAPDGKRIFYQRPDNTIWSVSPLGGDERPVPRLPAPRYWNEWALSPLGIYIVRWAPGPTISFYDFATLRITNLAQIPGKGASMGMGLALSPDGRWLLYTQVDSLVEPSGDLMMVENFR